MQEIDARIEVEGSIGDQSEEEMERGRGRAKSFSIN